MSGEIKCRCGRVERRGKKGGRKGIGRLTEGKGGRKDKEVGGLRWGEVRELQAHSFVPDFIWNMTTAQSAIQQDGLDLAIHHIKLLKGKEQASKQD